MYVININGNRALCEKGGYKQLSILVVLYLGIILGRTCMLLFVKICGVEIFQLNVDTETQFLYHRHGLVFRNGDGFEQYIVGLENISTKRLVLKTDIRTDIRAMTNVALYDLGK